MTKPGQKTGKIRWLWPWVVTVGQALTSWRAERNYLSLPEVLPTDRSEAPDGNAWPGVSIIVPARNEEANLIGLLDSLVAQDYPLYEVIVVDDASTDATASVVHRYEDRGVRLISSDGPPAGWTGKNAACWLGAGQSNHPWLLFVDADVELAPAALRSSLAFTLEHHAGAMSLFARQRCLSFWERLLLPFAYQHYFVGVNARRVHGVDGPALANGQFFLISRTAYRQAGGHAAHAASIIDDVALATRLKKIGVTPLACRGEALVMVRMYTSLRAIIAGFGKNSYLFLRQSPASGVQTALSTSLAASVLPLFVDAWRKRSWHVAELALLAYTVQVVGVRTWFRRFGVPWTYALLAPFSALGFLAIALNSMLRGGSLLWKGRRYRSHHARYSWPLRWFMEMGRALLTRTPRSIIDDSALAVKSLAQPPCVIGAEQMPVEGSFALVSNHYQRRDLWIGWTGAVFIDAIARRRQGNISIHYITTDRVRVGRFTVPGTRWLIGRVAQVWGLVLVTPPAVARGHMGRHRYALLRLLRLLKSTTDRSLCIGLMPEGDEGDTSGLIDAMPGSGRALSALSKRGLLIVPAAAWEVDSRLHVQFGAAFHLVPQFSAMTSEEIDEWGRKAVMQRIAALLPPAMRGKYGSVNDGALE